MRLIAWLLLLFGLPSAAHAEWLEASSDNFIVYADGSPASIKNYSEELERYHSAMVRLSRRDVPQPSPSSRLTVYVVGSDRNVRRIFGEGARNVAGFYIPRAGGSLAFVPKVINGSRETDFSQIVLLHEYAHHFLISSGSHGMPRWLSEGAAEFYASAMFMKDGSVSIGRPANHRASELFHASDVSVAELLDDALYAKRKSKSFDAFYGRSWLLFHFLTFDEARRGQLNTYWRMVADGTPSVEAGEAAFGDIATLQRDVDRYLKQGRMLSVTLTGLESSQVRVRQLSRGEEAMLPLRIRSKRGVNQEQALELVDELRPIAAAHPRDAAVLTALAEAEYDAGNSEAAVAAADAALAIDPTQVNAYVQKGYALFRLAEDSDDADGAYAKAVEPFQALNRIENDHPLPLIYFYHSFAERGAEPSPLAVQALERAVELAPFDLDLRMNAALQQAKEGRVAVARMTLQPVAASPHGGGMAESARRLLGHLDTVEEGQPLAGEQLAALFAAESETSAE